ncbi:7TM diverse intracellular signaling domain-containing protein [Bernardetia sp. ABR2-2B]|uniref:7TM diverse intracellular signaling domain-containing protein n=1 Tax=Bernardetia sp. ABR2-2B TaxID=3127472 RepID=UPI0030CF0ED2
MSIQLLAKRFLSVLFIIFLWNSLSLTPTFAQNETANTGNAFSIQICKDNTIFYVEKLNNDCFKEIHLDSLNKDKYQERIWLKVTVADTKKEFIDFNKNLDSIKVYHNNKTFLSGSLIARSEKQLPLSIAINAIQIPVYNQPFYVEIISSREYPISTGFEVLNEKNFNRIYVKERRETVDFQLLFQGMLWIILLYNFFLFLSSKEKVYLAYAIYIFGFSLFTSQNAGLLVDYFSSESPQFSLLFRMFGLAITAVGFFSFILTFLPKKVFNKFWTRFFYIGIVFSIGMLIPYIIINYGLENSYIYDKTSKIAHGIILLSNLVFIGYLAKNYWSDVLVRYFLLGSACAMGGAFLSNVLKAVFGDSLGDVYLVAQVGVISEILIFSLGLGLRMKNLEKENTRILEDQNKLLEQKVDERTKEISMKQEEILVQNEELHQQQEEIISQRDYIEKQNKQLKTTNTQFTDSVRYAKTIQKAILPMKQRVQHHFEESFVLFRPRDIVSGDFYWVYETNDPITNEEIVLVAVLDCTGHGVPGAFISLIGFAILNEIVSKQLTTKPAQILQRLDERLQESLRQKQTNNMDGMDVALCSIKKVDSIHHSTGKKQFEVTFSGAKRPLYYLKDNNFEELKGNRISVGGITKKKERRNSIFEEDKIILTKGDKIYLTSDGYADQNDKKKEKIGSIQLRQKLMELHILPLTEQKAKLEEFLDFHQGKEKQRDDITIMGVKL